MNFEEFKQQIMEDLPGALPERLSNVEIEPVSVTKLQHGSYDGITIREEGSNIGMNLDLTRLYDCMETGTAYDDVLAEAVAVISNATAQAPNIDVDRLMDYDQLKETLSIQVVPTASNAEMLENIPHKEMEDLSMVYRFVVSQDESGMQTILVTNKLLEQYGISEDQLHADAMENAPVFKPVQIRSMTEVLAEMMGQDFAEDMGLPTPDVGRDSTEKILVMVSYKKGDDNTGKATVCSIVNQKGGTGKTTTCENLGIGLANEGKKVLLIDSNPQGSLTISLGHPRPDEIDVTLSDILGKIIKEW